MIDSISKDVVTAIIITHNRKDRLKRAINSVLTQSYKHIELIVVNDGSSDGTREFLNELSGECNIKVIHHDKAKGACAARNSGIFAATGKYIAGLDDDDEWAERRIELMLGAYESKYSFICASDEWQADFDKGLYKRSGVISLDDILYENVVGNQIFTTKDKFISIKGFDESLPAAQDYDTWIRLIEMHGSALAIPEVLQRMYLDNSIPRITTSSSKFKGYLKCHFKHKHLMNRAHRRFQLFILYKCRNKKMSLKIFLTLLDIHRPIFKIKNFLLGY